MKIETEAILQQALSGRKFEYTSTVGAAAAFDRLVEDVARQYALNLATRVANRLDQENRARQLGVVPVSVLKVAHIRVAATQVGEP